LNLSRFLKVVLLGGSPWLVAVSLGIVIGFAIRAMLVNQDSFSTWARRHRISVAIAAGLAAFLVILCDWIAWLLALADSPRDVTTIIHFPISVLLGACVGIVVYKKLGSADEQPNTRTPD
jgi:hypothetical protein